MKIPIFNGEIHYKSPFSIATLVYRRVYRVVQSNMTAKTIRAWFLWVGVVSTQKTADSNRSRVGCLIFLLLSHYGWMWRWLHQTDFLGPMSWHLAPRQRERRDLSGVTWRRCERWVAIVAAVLPCQAVAVGMANIWDSWLSWSRVWLV